MVRDWLEYQYVGSGAYYTNDSDDDGLAGSSDDGWSLSASTLDKDGTAGNDRAGAAWFIGDESGTDWRFEYDFSGTTDGSTDIVIYLGLDDGDNSAGTHVVGFGDTGGPEDDVAVGDAWTIVTAKVAVGSDNSLALPDLTGFDIMVMKIMNGATEGSFDNFELLK